MISYTRRREKCSEFRVNETFKIDPSGINELCPRLAWKNALCPSMAGKNEGSPRSAHA